MKIQLSLTALLLTSTFALAGGDIAPVEPEIIIPTVIPTAMPLVVEEPQKTGLYVGLGYSCMQLTTDTPDEEYMGKEVSANIGYNIHENLAIEARYTASVGDINYKTWDKDYDIKGSSMSNAAIYLKPQINLGGLGLYALLGYGQVTLKDDFNSFSENTFQYGIGTNFAVSAVTMFVDYRRLYDATDFDSMAKNQDVAVNSFTLGVNYEF